MTSSLEKHDFQVSEFMRDLSRAGMQKLLLLPEIVVMGDSDSANIDFFSWMLGEDVDGTLERYEMKFEAAGQTVGLLNAHVANVFEKYTLNDDSLYLVINSYTDTERIGSQTINVTGHKDMWKIDGKNVTVDELWNRLIKWQREQYRISVPRVWNSITEGYKILKSELKNISAKDGEVPVCLQDSVRRFFIRYIFLDKNISDFRDELKENLKTTRYFQMLNDLTADLMSDIRQRICTAKKERSLYFFVDEGVFAKLVEELLIKEMVPACKIFFDKVQEFVLPRLSEHCESIYGHLALGAEIKRRVERELARNLDIWIRGVRRDASEFSNSQWFDTCGRVQMDPIKRKRARKYEYHEESNSSSISSCCDSSFSESDQESSSSYDTASATASRAIVDQEVHTEIEIDEMIATKMFAKLTSMTETITARGLVTEAFALGYIHTITDRLWHPRYASLKSFVRFTDSFLVLKKTKTAEFKSFKWALGKCIKLKRKLLTI